MFQLLDCVAIPVALVLSFLVLGVRYRMVHIVGVSVCLMGVGCLVWAGIDDNNDPTATGNYTVNVARDIRSLVATEEVGD